MFVMKHVNKNSLYERPSYRGMIKQAPDRKERNEKTLYSTPPGLASYRCKGESEAIMGSLLKETSSYKIKKNKKSEKKNSLYTKKIKKVKIVYDI